jgi:hypothetical protein
MLGPDLVQQVFALGLRAGERPVHCLGEQEPLGRLRRHLLKREARDLEVAVDLARQELAVGGIDPELVEHRHMAGG